MFTKQSDKKKIQSAVVLVIGKASKEFRYLDWKVGRELSLLVMMKKELHSEKQTHQLLRPRQNLL